MGAYWYRITLKPLQSLMFSSSQTHGRKDKEPVNFYTHSMLLPQQTTLLGVFRKYLLEHYGLLKSDWNYSTDEKVKIKEYIGEHPGDLFDEVGFNVGHINRLTPVYLIKRSEGEAAISYDPVALDYIKSQDGVRRSEYERFKGGCEQVYYQLKDYDAKKQPLAEGCWQARGTTDTVPESDLLYFETVIGNAVQLGKRTEGDQTFYKQKRVSLQRDVCYAFEIQLKEPLKKINSCLVEIGADRAKCEMRIEVLEHYLENMHEEAVRHSEQEICRIQLLSDAYLPLSTLKRSSYRVSKVINYGNLAGSSQDERKLKAKQQYELLRRGSILLAKYEQAIEITEELKKYKKARNIGFNQYEVRIISIQTTKGDGVQ